MGSLSDLLNALLDVSRLDAQLVVPNRQAVSINRIFEEVQHEFASEAVEKELHLRIVPTSLSCDSDPTLLKQILANLLSNAIKYTDRGRILVGCRHRGREIEIQVLDTGIGIPQEKHALIFEEFVQLDNFERNRDKGLGLDCRSSSERRHFCAINPACLKVREGIVVFCNGAPRRKGGRAHNIANCAGRYPQYYSH